MCSPSRLLGKRALITGAGTGIGREVALEFARQGADIALHYSHDDSGAKSAAEEISRMGRKASLFKADFTEAVQAQELAEWAIEFLGGVDCLVNNAGITFNKPFLQVTLEQFETMFDVNIRGQFLITQRIVQDMLSHGGGTICNMTSVHGIHGAPEHSVYAGTKGAVIGYTRALAVELAHKGIRLNALAPGAVLVDSHYTAVPGLTDQAVLDFGTNSIPVARIGAPLDIAKVACFLCSDDAEYIVGQTIIVDGGTSALMSIVRDFRTESGNKFGSGYLPGV